MTKTYTFKVKENERFGGLGFAPSWYPAGDPLGGMAVAHDILEHFPKDNGGAAGEFQALGAALLIRGETGYFQRNGNVNPPEEHLSSDFSDIWQVAPYVPSCPSTIRDTDLLDTISVIVNKGIKRIREDGNGEPGPTSADRENIIRWIATGYKRAKKRYSKLDIYTLAHSVFGKIEEEADKALKYAEEWQVLTVKVDLKGYHVSVDLDYPEDDY